MSKSKISTIIKYLVFVSFGVGLFYYVFHSQDQIYKEQCLQNPLSKGKCSLWEKLIEDIGKLNWYLISLVMVGFIISNLMRARRWTLMLHPLGIKARLWETFWAVQLGYFANLALPRMGEIARAGSVARRLKAPLEKVLGTIIMDRLLDVIVLGIFTAVGFFLQTQTLYNFLSRQANVSIWHLMVATLIGIAGIVFVIMLFRTDRFYHPVIEKIKSKLAGFSEGIMGILKSNRPKEMVFLSFGIWLLYYSMAILGLKAFAPTASITLVQGLIVFIIGSLGMIIPTPGGIGPYHFLTMSALGIYGVSSIDGFSYANLSFLIVQVITISLFGIIGMTVLSKKRPEDQEVYHESIILQ